MKRVRSLMGVLLVLVMLRGVISLVMVESTRILIGLDAKKGTEKQITDTLTQQ